MRRSAAGATMMLAGALTLGPSLSAQAPSSAPAPETLLLRPGDMIRITVWPQAEYGGEFPVEDTGLAYLPVLGGVRVTGLSLEELRRQLRQGYAEFMQNPVVSVTPVIQVAVLGHVRSPGLYPIPPTASLFEAIAQAGGFTIEARQNKVRVVREGEVVEVDAARALERGEGLRSLQLRSGDQIVVPAQGGINVRNVLYAVQTAATLVLLYDRLTDR